MFIETSKFTQNPVKALDILRNVFCYNEKLMIVLSPLHTPLHSTPPPFFLNIFLIFGKCENLTLKKAAASYTESNFTFFGSICQDIEVPQQQLRSKQTWLSGTSCMQAACLLACLQRPSATKSLGNQLLTIEPL